MRPLDRNLMPYEPCSLNVPLPSMLTELYIHLFVEPYLSGMGGSFF